MSLNKVQLIGHLGQAPDVRYTANEAIVVTLNIATSRTWKDKTTKEKKEATEWHRVILWNRLAEIAKEYLTTGSQVYIEGALRTRKYTDKNDIERYTTEIVGQSLQMLGKGKAKDSGGNHLGTAEHHEIPPIESDELLDMDQYEDDIPF